LTVTIIGCTRYHVNQICGGAIGSGNRASFSVQRGNGIRILFRWLFRFVKPLLNPGAKVVGKEALKHAPI